MDNALAIKAGPMLHVRHVLAGRILSMPASTVIYGKLLDCGAGTVESVAR